MDLQSRDATHDILRPSNAASEIERGKSKLPALV